jgi:hypothetical protein
VCKMKRSRGSDLDRTCLAGFSTFISAASNRNHDHAKVVIEVKTLLRFSLQQLILTDSVTKSFDLH